MGKWQTADKNKPQGEQEEKWRPCKYLSLPSGITIGPFSGQTFFPPTVTVHRSELDGRFRLQSRVGDLVYYAGPAAWDFADD